MYDLFGSVLVSLTGAGRVLRMAMWPMAFRTSRSGHVEKAVNQARVAPQGFNDAHRRLALGTVFRGSGVHGAYLGAAQARGRRGMIGMRDDRDAGGSWPLVASTLLTT